MNTLALEWLPFSFSVCKVAAFSQEVLSAPFTFAAKTDGECSLVCPTENVPNETLARQDGWRAFRVRGVLDFSLVGILAALSGALAQSGVSVFAVSTYDTDYLLVQKRQVPQAVTALQSAGFDVELPE